MDLKEQIKLSDIALNNKDFIKAITLLEKALEIYPNNFELNFKLGLIYNVLGKLKESINYYQKSVSINPNFSPAYCNLGIIYDKLNNKDLAIKNYLTAIKIDPKNSNAHYNLANTYFNIEDFNNAEKHYFFSINTNSKNIYAYNNLLQIYDRTNDNDKLDKLVEKAKKVFGKNKVISFFEGISEYKKNNYKRVIELYEDLELDPNDKIKNIVKSNILAKCYDHIGKYNEAFKFFEISNNITNDTYKDKFKKENYSKLINDRLNFFSNINSKISKKKIKLDNNADPIFLIGFPRSGTTLLDTILRTHESIEVLEEKPLIQNMINEINIHIKGDFSNLSKIDDETIKRIRLSYFENREKIISLDKTKIYIDKFPLNIIYIAEIDRIFPNAKYILSLRNPYDAVLSCFMQSFAPNDAMSNFYNLNDASNFYNIVMSLWTKYLEILDIDMHTIKYEEIVSNFESSISSVINFLNLKWNDNLKEFNKTADKRSMINTPSYNQVNKPLYTNSIERWKNYNYHFNDQISNLEKWITKFKY
jgi:tetratricopeptide (TPR) repeat protein